MHKTILIVEDYADTRAMMKFLLERSGYDVMEACDGLAALDCVQSKRPDLILMDISMPNMDGLVATQKIRDMDGCRTIPIIAVTAYGNSYYRQALEAGCDELINKPLDFEKLEPILQQYLS